MRILVVEDETNLRDVLTKQLTAAGYSVDSCGDGLTAEDYIAVTPYDVVILDIMLPGKDGLAVLRDMRQRGASTLVMLLTARDSVEDRVTGLDAGADEYLVKPFALDELLARLRLLLRRQNGQKTTILSLADLSMDLAAHTVTRSGQAISLSAKEYAILEYMLHHAGQVLSREQIENHVWNYDFEGGSNVVDVYMRYLRKKIDAPFAVKLIHTVRGAGYVLREAP